MDDFAFQCCEILEGASTCLSLTFSSWVVSGKILTEADWTLTGNKAAIRGGKKCSLQKFYPLFFWEKMCKLGDAESEQQKILLPLISLGEWGATGQTSVCSPGLLEGWCATLCLRHGNPPRSCKSDHLTCGVLLTKVCVKTNCLEKGVGANEVLLHLHLGGLRSLLSFFYASQRMDRESERDSGPHHS